MEKHIAEALVRLAPAPSERTSLPFQGLAYKKKPGNENTRKIAGKWKGA